MNMIIGRYDVDASSNRKDWLRKSFDFQATPIFDDSPDRGSYVGVDSPTIQDGHGEIKDGFFVIITAALRDEFETLWKAYKS